MLEEMLIRFQSANLYEILLVGAEASQEEIQNAYHDQAKKLHPDRFQSSDFSTEVRGKAEQVFARINEAYFTLKNPYARAAYDEKRFAPGGKTAGTASGVAPPEETAEALFREGRILLARGDPASAAERLKGCVWLCPEKAAYQHYLGVAQSKIASLRKSAEQHLLRSIELEGSSVDSHLALASLYIDVNLPRKAELQLQRALVLDPENVEGRKLSAELKKLR
jgi:curved DNA-binding protein CbpA